MAQQPRPGPIVDQAAAMQMNLTVLRRLDPAVEELLATAGHVALYDFDIPTKKWARKDVEGSLFLVKRRAQPRFQFIILNKKSADNFVEDVMGNFQCEVNKPYLLYRNKAGEVVGIWFYDDEECDRISALLQRIATTFAAPSAAELGGGGKQANGGGAPADAKSQAAAVAAAAAAAQQAQQAQQQAGGDDGFWDHKVEVPAELDMPQLSAQGSSAMPTPQQAQQEAAGGDNALMRIFAGMKVSPQPAQQAQQAAQQQQQQQATGANNSVLPLLSPTAPVQLSLPVAGQEAAPAAAAAPAQASAAPAPPAASGPAGLPLLTPQFLRQAAAAPAPAPAPAPQPVPQPQPQQGAGQALLQQLQGRPAAPRAAAAPAPAAAQPSLSPHTPVDLNEAAERALRAKVRAFLRGLADNDNFVEIVTSEARKAGIL